MTAKTVAVDDAIDVYLQRKAVGDPDGPGAGAYAANAESILRRFSDWLERDHDLTTLVDLEPAHMRAYAKDLSSRVDRGEYTASSARTYYAVVRAFLTWCVRGGLLSENPAACDDATAALPDSPVGDAVDAAEPDRNGGGRTGDSSRTGTDGEPAWASERHALEAYVRDRARDAEALADPEERLTRLREYALVAVLAHSGARGSELFCVPTDDRRTGATWDDVDFYDGTIRVLGRSQRLEEVTLLAPARTPLRRYRVVLDPPANDWPLFPTRHAPSIARRVRDVLRERGHDEAEVEALLEGTTAAALARERSIAPPAITTEGARSVLRRLCAEAGVDVDGLTPRDVRAASGDARERREATPTSPALRTPDGERSLAVLERRSVVVDVGADRDDRRTDRSTDVE